MKKNIFFSLLLFYIFLPGSNDYLNAREKRAEIFKGTYNNLVKAGKSISVSGEVKKFLIKLGGSLEVSSTVGKDVVSLFADVKINRDARINGDLIVIGGTLEVEKGAVIKGSKHYFNFSMNNINSSIKFISFTKDTLTIFKIIFALLSLILSLFVFALIPAKISYASEIFEENKFKFFNIGFITFLVSVITFVVFLILSFIFIGIPLLIIELLFLLVLIVFGRVVLYFYLGKKIIAISKLQVYSPGIYLLLGAFFYFILDFIPIAGFFILKILVLIEIGISVGFILRNRLNLKSLSDKINNYRS